VVTGVASLLRRWSAIDLAIEVSHLLPPRSGSQGQGVFEPGERESGRTEYCSSYFAIGERKSEDKILLKLFAATITFIKKNEKVMAQLELVQDSKSVFLDHF